MSSAKKFSQTLVRMGKGAIFAKSDFVDAYKLIPSHTSEWAFYGFKWLGTFFADTTIPFGLTAAPAKFDDFGETNTNIAATITETPKNLIHRQLDDVPTVAPMSTNFVESFSSTYKSVCKKLKVELAPPCPSHDKQLSVRFWEFDLTLRICLGSCLKTNGPKPFGSSQVFWTKILRAFSNSKSFTEKLTISLRLEFFSKVSDFSKTISYKHSKTTTKYSWTSQIN